MTRFDISEENNSANKIVENFNFFKNCTTCLAFIPNREISKLSQKSIYMIEQFYN